MGSLTGISSCKPVFAESVGYITVHVMLQEAVGLGLLQTLIILVTGNEVETSNEGRWLLSLHMLFPWHVQLSAVGA